MTKSQLIQAINARMPDLQPRDAEIAVNIVFDTIVEALAKQEGVEVRGFGRFSVRHRRARHGRNPKTGALVSVAAKRVPFFTTGQDLRVRVGQSKGTQA